MYRVEHVSRAPYWAPLLLAIIKEQRIDIKVAFPEFFFLTRLLGVTLAACAVTPMPAQNDSGILLQYYDLKPESLPPRKPRRITNVEWRLLPTEYIAVDSLAPTL